MFLLTMIKVKEMKLMSMTSSAVVFTLSCLAMTANAQNTTGGVSLGATRVIYAENAKQTSLALLNHSKADRYLINSWVEDEHDNKTKDFLITPPLFVAEPKSENTLRIISLSPKLPQDRESVYWINVKAIPSIDKDALENQNTLQLAVLSRIKLFVRPVTLKKSPEEYTNSLTFTKKNGGVEAENPSPYYMSMTNVNVDSTRVANVMVAPFEKKMIANISGKKVSYQLVNDYGGLVSKIEFELK